MLKFVIISYLSLAIAGFGVFAQVTAIAQNPPSTTHKDGFWQPVARLGNKSPITINLINKAGFVIDYGITGVKMEQRKIRPKQQANLRNLQYPLQLVIYPDYNIAGSANYFLQYAVKTKGQVVEVTIEEADNANESHRALDIQETGAIYLY